MSDKTPHTNKGEVLSDIIGNLSNSLSWYHGRQPEVFLQHDSHCACQDVLELRSRTSKREFSGWNQRFKFWVLRRVFVIQKYKFFLWNHVFFVRKKQNLTQILERHFQLKVRGQQCRSWIKNLWCLSSLSTNVFGRCAWTGSELFSLLISFDATKFVLLRVSTI